jgi:hypothetical protein
MTKKTPASKENYSQSENKRSEEYGETLSRIDDATKKTPAEIEIEKLEKGCGKEFVDLSLQLRKICGKENTWLCPDCYAKLSGLKQGIELGRKESEEDKDNLLNKLSTYDKLLNSKIDIVSKTIIDNLERENNELKIIAKENKEAYNFKMLECVDLKLKFEQQLSNQKKELLSSLQEKIEVLRQDLWFVNTTDDKFLDMIFSEINERNRKKVDNFKEEILKLFKEMGI